MYSISYYDVFAIVKDGELYPVGEFCIGDMVTRKILTSSLIIIPDEIGEEEDDQYAIVRHPAVGNALGLATGDKVLLLKWSNYKIDFNGKTYLRFRESEVIALC